MFDSLCPRFLRCLKAMGNLKGDYPKNPQKPPKKLKNAKGKSQMFDGLQSEIEVLTAHSCGLQTYTVLICRCFGSFSKGDML